MVRAEKASRLLDVLLGALSDLRRYRERIDRARLSSDRDSQNMVLHALYVAVQSSIDLALHAGADAGQPTAVTYQEAFRNLARAGLLDQAFAERLARWAGMRNVLAHQYPVIDFDRVHEGVSKDLEDLERFARIVATWIGESDPA